MLKKDHGWIKIFIFCLLIFIIFVTAIGHIALKKLKKNSPRIIAKFIEISAEGFFSQIELPAAEHKEVMDSIRLFTQDIRDGKVSLQQGKKIAQALNDRSLMGAILIRSFEAKYINPSFLQDDERKVAHITLTRFVHGSIENKISMDKLNSILDMISEDRGNESKDGRRRLKQSITTEELMNLLKEMKIAADESKIENREFKIDISEIIREAIKKGMADGQDVKYTLKDLSFKTTKNINIGLISSA